MYLDSGENNNNIAYSNANAACRTHNKCCRVQHAHYKLCLWPRGVAMGIFMWKHLIICQCTGGGMGIVKLPQAGQQAAVGRGRTVDPTAG